MKRLFLILVVAVLAAAAIYQFVWRDTIVEANVSMPTPTSVIGTGESAVGVGPDGTILDWQPAPADETLPLLPIAEAPAGKKRLTGNVLKQAKVLGAAPKQFRPFIAGSSYGEMGIEVMLRAGIELRFGDSSQRKLKWAAAAAVLADSSIESPNYVDLSAPRRPAVDGSAETLTLEP